MKYLKIQNKGELDIRLVALMGGTTKADDQFKIGQWGSGLKYTMAWLIKNNLSFHIFIGDKKVDVTTEVENISGTDFEIICIDGKRTSITTQMGGNAWEAWMIVRELWCNALDEGDELKEITTDISGLENTTTFYIQLSSDIKKVWDNWSDYFIHGAEPMFESSTHKIYQGGNTLKLYKQGVLIYENPNAKSLFTYDIKQADINELREFRGMPSREMTHALSNSNSKVIQYFLENISEKYHEGEMDYDWWVDFSSSWKDTIGDSKIIHQKAIETMISRGIDFDKSSVIIVPEKVYKFLTKQFQGIGALRTSNGVNEFYETYNAELDMKIKGALATLETCRYFIHPELKFVYGVFGDKTTLACVKIDEKVIMVSEAMVNRPMFDVIGMIIEENEHFNTGFKDHSREFQQHFIDLYTKTLLEKNEVNI